MFKIFPSPSPQFSTWVGAPPNVVSHLDWPDSRGWLFWNSGSAVIVEVTVLSHHVNDYLALMKPVTLQSGIVGNACFDQRFKQREHGTNEEKTRSSVVHVFSFFVPCSCRLNRRPKIQWNHIHISRYPLWLLLLCCVIYLLIQESLHAEKVMTLIF